MQVLATSPSLVCLAELIALCVKTALLMCIKYIEDAGPIGQYTVYTDSSVTLIGWDGGNRATDQWQQIQNIRLDAAAKGKDIKLMKVKSHATEEEMQQGLATPQTKQGNDAADEHALKGSQHYQITDNEANLVNLADAMTWTILRRLQSIVEGHISHDRYLKDHEPKKKGSPLDEKLTELGHDIYKIGARHQGCGRCSQTWQTRQRSNIINMGACPGPGKWGELGADPEIPVHQARGSEILWAGHRLHRTHSPGWKKGLVICWLCGAYTHGTRVRYLIDKCPLAPRSKHAHLCVGAFRKGKHPLGDHGTWPQPEGRKPSIFRLA